MQRRHFELIARILREAQAIGNISYNIVDLHIAFADTLQDTNVAFDRIRFFAACQPKPTTKA